MTEKAPVSTADFTIPLVDFSPFIENVSIIQKQQCAHAVLKGLTETGFVYLKNHNISRDQVANTFEASADFFSRSQAQKDALAWSSPSSNRGYMRMGREKVTDLTSAEDAASLRKSNPDMKETIDVGREGVEEYPNQWPEQFDRDGDVAGAEFKKQVYAFWLACKDMHVQVMRCIALGMGYDLDFFDSYTSIGDNTLRLLHYPSAKKSAFETAERAGPHCDFGTVTLLFQDSCGGLEVCTPAGEFVPATPIPDTIVVNAGDLLARWSNDFIKSTKHRVVQPTTVSNSDVYPDRYSIAYFCNPDFDKIIEALPGTWGEDTMKEKKYQAIKSGEYVAQRLGVTVATS